MLADLSAFDRGKVKRACSVACIFVSTLAFGRGKAWAETLMDRACPSDSESRYDPGGGAGQKRLMGPFSDLTERPGRFCGMPDEVLLGLIKRSAIQKARINPSGFSLSLRLELAGPIRAIFKPSQRSVRSVPRKEVLAYRLNRFLGLSRVPPATSRKIRVSEYYKVVRDAKRIRDRVLRESYIWGKALHGQASWWIPKIRHVSLEKPWWRARWERWLQADHPLPAEQYELAGQLSRMMVFDALINNQDRFSGNNFIATLDGNHLYFMDHAVSFFPTSKPRGSALMGFIKTSRFSVRLYRALKGLTEGKVKEILEEEQNVSWPFLIHARELKALMSRRDYILTRIDAMIIRWGWDAAMVFP